MRNACVALALALLAVGGPARAQGSLLFDDFQTFCVATKADPAAVKRAVEGAGWIAQSGPRATTIAIPSVQQSAHQAKQTWRRTVGGRTMKISAATLLVPATIYWGTETSFQCDVTSVDAKDDAGLAAVRKWIAVPQNGADPAITSFDFRVAGGRHIAIRPQSERAMREYWAVWISSGGSSSTVFYFHKMHP
ncbi:MAG TPA: hypothetical protein VG387_07510 [Rhizomicrobium sp.]|nr:hypothetical protein [Rhizomicrobium sp.]